MKGGRERSWGGDWGKEVGRLEEEGRGLKTCGLWKAGYKPIARRQGSHGPAPHCHLGETPELLQRFVL